MVQIQFSLKKKIGRPEHSLTPTPTSDNISFFPYPPPTPTRSGCASPPLGLIFVQFLVFLGLFIACSSYKTKWSSRKSTVSWLFNILVVHCPVSECLHYHQEKLIIVIIWKFCKKTYFSKWNHSKIVICTAFDNAL